MMLPRRSAARAVLAIGLALLGTAGCAGPFPADSEDTLARASGGTLRVGVSENPPWTEVGDDGSVSGVEAELVTRYAAEIGSRVEWTPGAESVLAQEVAAGRLDMLVGGLTSRSPWSSEVALTRPWGTATGPDGQQQELVMGVRLGENALLVSLETFLAEQERG
ncbi:transporter substrate-binding domain-containing protein [Auraticoccus sp. F435]|uniref:Transporter substrate-binding domain-containing protein n=1 Tax=Auraticoccus cholistanensis TaxID=2656650 RepID=A0A6A9UYL7_9ACTN|nr:transporter substrate-binding domain-containing protein [Auraticoccus cholistanensis]MVA76677.1 transporter substrate-binding domain-containing protein [Auraticoccus cholistanensis]